MFARHVLNGLPLEVQELEQGGFGALDKQLLSLAANPPAGLRQRARSQRVRLAGAVRPQPPRFEHGNGPNLPGGGGGGAVSETGPSLNQVLEFGS